jgi:hypothetical protein
VDEGIKCIFDNNQEMVFTKEKYCTLKYLEGKRKDLLKEEVEWRFKSRVLWLSKGEMNTKFFHKYASHGRNVNML